MTTRKKPSSDYEVGFGKPPLHTRFKPGQSGNPKGRKKKSETMNDVVRRVFEEKVKIRDANGSRSVPALEVLVRCLKREAINGKVASAKTLMPLVREAFEPTELKAAQDDATVGQISDEDQEILARAFYKNQEGYES